MSRSSGLDVAGDLIMTAMPGRLSTTAALLLVIAGITGVASLRGMARAAEPEIPSTRVLAGQVLDPEGRPASGGDRPPDRPQEVRPADGEDRQQRRLLLPRPGGRDLPAERR